MNHEQFDHLIRAAGTVLDDDTIIVIGSQSVLASVRAVPDAAARSIELDVLPEDGSWPLPVPDLTRRAVSKARELGFPLCVHGRPRRTPPALSLA